MSLRRFVTTMWPKRPAFVGVGQIKTECPVHGRDHDFGGLVRYVELIAKFHSLGHNLRHVLAIGDARLGA
jgi:hypothetical protein